METQRQEIERAVFNRLVHSKWDQRSLMVDKERPPFADYSGDLFDGAQRFMGRLNGMNILELGCGSGDLAVWFALQGAQVTGIDVSDESIRVAKKRAEENGVASWTNFLACPAEAIPMPDAAFDTIFINVSLHHLELEQALAECRRLLKPQGRFIAVEPFSFSKMIQKIRTSRFVTKWYPIRQETPTERILTVEDLDRIKTVFSGVQITPFRILSPFIFKAKPVFHAFSKLFPGKDWETKKQNCNRFFQRVDEFLLSHLPFLKYFSRYIVIACVK